MKKIFVGIVTVARSDYGIYRPILNLLSQSNDFEYGLYVTGTHLSYEHGYTKNEILSDGHPVLEEVDLSLSSDSAEAISKSMSICISGFGECFGRRCPDILMVLGDRFEMFSVAMASVPFNIPIAHIHGGEITEGAIDNVIRHAMTKLSHIHFVSTELAAKRILQMGEAKEHIVVSGAPGLDNIKSLRLLNRSELKEKYGIPEKLFLLVTYHHVTLESGNALLQMQSLLAALKSTGYFVVFTSSNADLEGGAINQTINDYVEQNENALLVKNFGIEDYFGIMSHAAVMVGNSSSGIIEAATFKLPVVNIGNRQGGRERSNNVIDVGYSKAEIERGIKEAISDEFGKSLELCENIYGNGDSAPIIVNKLKELFPFKKLLTKKFNML